MGFLKFLTKEKRPEAKVPSGNSLDIPPPPGMGSMSSDLPSFAGPRIESSLPPIKPFNPSESSFKFDQNDLSALPEFRGFDVPTPSFAVDLPPAPEPMQMAPPIAMQMPVSKSPEPMQIMQSQNLPIPMPKQFETAPLIETPARRQAIVSEDHVFVKAPVFREIVEDLDSVFESNVHSELGKIRDMKDAEYAKWSTALEDMQRDLMFIDKTLFEV